MEIDFYSCTDPPNKLKKTPTLIEQREGLLHDITDLSSPTIQVRGSYNLTCNYVHIPLLERWYWIENVTLDTNSLFTVYLAIDPLQSFKDYINGDHIKSYSVTPVQSTRQPFSAEHIIISTIEGVR